MGVENQKNGLEFLRVYILQMTSQVGLAALVHLPNLAFCFLQFRVSILLGDEINGRATAFLVSS